MESVTLYFLKFFDPPWVEGKKGVTTLKHREKFIIFGLDISKIFDNIIKDIKKDLLQKFITNFTEYFYRKINLKSKCPNPNVITKSL